MGNIFSATEVVEIGIQIEKNGRDFYSGLVNLSKNPKAKEIFEYLTKEEGKHIITFENILKEVKKYGPSEAYPGEYFAYLRVLSDEYVFTKENKGTDIVRDLKNDLEAVEMGIGFEKDSILFYNEMKRFVLEGEQKVIERLIEQEQGHLRKLGELKQQLKA